MIRDVSVILGFISNLQLAGQSLQIDRNKGLRKPSSDSGRLLYTFVTASELGLVVSFDSFWLRHAWFIPGLAHNAAQRGNSGYNAL